MHRIYCINIEGEPVYVGYTTQNIEDRLKEHLYNATARPNKVKELQNVVRGGPTTKDAVFKAAIEEGMEITVKLLEEQPLWVELDEQQWIEQIGQDYKLLNTSKGGVWQPYIKQSNGTVVEKADLTTAEARSVVQTWKANTKPKKVARKIKPEILKHFTDEQFRSEQDYWWHNRLFFIKYPGTITEWYTQWSNGGAQ